MNPKEKAKELINKFYVELLDTDSDFSEEILITVISKRLALIAVDEIIKSNPFEKGYGEPEPMVYYWQEVKSEIEKSNFGK